MCRCEGYGFQAVYFREVLLYVGYISMWYCEGMIYKKYSRIGCINLSVWV